jgi:hypothetical protein
MATAYRDKCVTGAGYVALAAAVGLPATIAALTIAQASFMRTLGWDPVRAPTMDWPSGLALGPFGRVLTAGFVLSSGALAVLASGAARWLSPRAPRIARPVGLALGLAALGMAGLAFTTDPTLSTRTATWHGRLHDTGYVVLGAGLVLAAIAGIAHGVTTRNYRLGVSLCAAVASVVIGFALKGWLLYAAFSMIFGCIAALAWAMIRSDDRQTFAHE